MTGYEERQDIARRLRDYSVQGLRYSDPICELVCSTEIDCIGFDSCGGSDMMPECVKLVFDRLADLVEPDPERTARMEYDTVHYDYVCTHCGERFYTMMYEAVVGDDHRVDFKPMRYCPNCGARFKEDDDGNE